MTTRSSGKVIARALLCSALGAACISGQTCPALTDEVRSSVAAYVADQYEFAPDLRVEDEGLTVDSCFRRIKIRAAAPKQSLEMFLSPDQRFLLEGLLDMKINPSSERQRVAEETDLALRADSSPLLGPDAALVTLVEFSDFRCPFCKRFADFLDQAPAGDSQGVRIVFKFRPLAMHAWARHAALAAICASLQSNQAFWQVERFLFANQGTITPANLEDKIAAFAEGFERLDLGRMERCLAEGTAESILLRDEKLADLYHVNAVPTIFINGARSAGFGSAEELQAALRAAAAGLASAPAAHGLGARPPSR